MNDLTVHPDNSPPIIIDLNDSSEDSRNTNSVTADESCGEIGGSVNRRKDVSPCYVCGARAHGYNFDAITCESCKAFFRRNALKPMERFRCRGRDSCVITLTTRKRCKRCRLIKCFKVGMRKEWILTDEEKRQKRKKIERNRQMKQIAIQQQQQHISQSQQLPVRIYKQTSMFDKEITFLEQINLDYHSVVKQYPQPIKFRYRNDNIAITEDKEYKLLLIKDLTRELTQMTISRLLHFFSFIPEFQVLTSLEKIHVLKSNLLPVFMLHGSLTYDADNDTFVDKSTRDQPYDAKYLAYVYGSNVYNQFVALSKILTSFIYFYSSSSLSHEQLTSADSHSHTLLLLLMIILLFSNGFESHEQQQRHHKTLTTNRSLINSYITEKLAKIQQYYIDITCRCLKDKFGLKDPEKIFSNLLPYLFNLQKLCSTLANVNLCENAEQGFSSNMISSGNEENQAPDKQLYSPPVTSSSTTSPSSPGLLSCSPSSNNNLSATTTALYNCQVRRNNNRLSDSL